MEHPSFPTGESSAPRAIGIFAADVWICVDLLAFNPPVTLVYSGVENCGLCRYMYIALSKKLCKEFYRVFFFLFFLSFPFFLIFSFSFFFFSLFFQEYLRLFHASPECAGI